MTMQNQYPRVMSTVVVRALDEEKKNRLKSCIGLVKYAAKKFRFQYARTEQVLEETDLVQYGLIGLLDAIERFEPNKGVKFETYAMTRIRGSMLDGLRKLDWVPRSVRKRKLTAQKAVGEMESVANRSFSSLQIATKLSMTLDEYNDLINDARGFEAEGRLNYEEENELLQGIPADRTSDPYEIVAAEETRARLIAAVESLPKRDRLIITLYYYEGLTFREIGGLLNISESRVCQIQKSVLKELRSQLTSLVTVP